MTTNSTEKARNNAIISYITIIGVIIAYYLNNDSENKSTLASFHIRQSLGLWLTFYALGYLIGSFDSWLVSASFYIFFVILFVYGLANAITKKEQVVPLIGTFFQRLFSSIS